jgi:hypothetical protein
LGIQVEKTEGTIRLFKHQAKQERQGGLTYAPFSTYKRNIFHRKNLKMRNSRSSKVHVVAQAVLTGALEQDGEMGAFRLARSAAD